MPSPPAKASLRPRYHPFYCEENVYHLALEPALRGRARQVVFISNADRSCAVWRQRAAVLPSRPIVWDYHVILLCADPWEVFDLDTTLGLPCPAARYLAKSFRQGIPRELLPAFRVIDADLFTDHFASDRSHMRSSTDVYLRPPPPWPPIGAAGVPSNLARWIDMATPFHGDVIDLAALAARVAA